MLFMLMLKLLRRPITSSNENDTVKHELRITSYDLRLVSYELRVESLIA